MKFMSILLKEGRKEDLIKKYESKFGVEGLNKVLDVLFIKETNYKYADFVLKHLNPNFSWVELNEIVEGLRKFDKIQSKLEKKDINSYTGFFDLITSVNEYTKDREKPKSKKIYEDNKFIVIEPQNFVASCKYGSKTRWCTTMKDNDDYFNRYTSGRQGLYYVISKKDLEQNLYKIALHFDKSGELTVYDAADSTFGKREIALFKTAYPEMWEAIKEYHEEKNPDQTREKVIEGLSNRAERSAQYHIVKDSYIQLRLLGFEIVEQNGDNFMVNNEILILDFSDVPMKLLDKYMLFINASIIKKDGLRALDIECQLQSLDDDVKLDLNLDGFNFHARFGLSDEVDIPNEVADIIFNDIYKTLRNDGTLLSYFHKATVWTPNKFYGYTFGKNKGLIKKLVDYLDSGAIGTKVDFLESIGKVSPSIENGKKVYPKTTRGYLSSFFASAKLAGILGYRKIGNQYLLIKGPNFEAFKKGELKAL